MLSHFFFDLIGTAHAQFTGSVNQMPAATQETDINTLILRLANWGLIVAGAAAVVYIIYGGIQYITAAGDQEKASGARTTITNAMIGIIIIALSLVLIGWVSSLTNNIAAGGAAGAI